jgi:uncharacterized protein YcfL
MKKLSLVILLVLLVLFCCSEKENILTEATYVVFYSDKNTDTLNISTIGILRESSIRGTNEISIINSKAEEWCEIIYRNTAPFKRIKFKQTIIK